jgi:oligoribonuclease NrnB/cAMP/cGMP phosphodiesterase (DHH superfamily)
LIVEAYGERVQFHTKEKEEMIESLHKLVEVFNSGSIWPSNKRIKIKYINDETSTKSFISDGLYKLGFEPEMMEMVYWKRV